MDEVLSYNSRSEETDSVPNSLGSNDVNAPERHRKDDHMTVGRDMLQRHIREQMILSEEDNVAKQSSALNNSSAFSLLDNNFECWQVYYNKLDFFCLESGSSVLLMNGHRHG